MSQALDFLVQRSDLRSCKFALAPGADEIDLQPGQILLAIDRFAFTSNNVTYAAFGEAMSYWGFFPGPEGWGRIPVWGFADVIASRHDAIKVGERVYGYLPMSTHVVLQPDRVSDAGFIDGAPHRSALHSVYNRYVRTAADPAYDASRESEQMLLQPLFTTSFLIEDFLADNQFFGARAVALSSASSKTAYGLAFCLSRRPQPRPEVIGLTSAGNAAFVRGLGCYDRVVTYERIASISAEMPLVYVDMSGNAGVRSDVHHHFGENLKHSCVVGGTHWEKRGPPANLPGAQPKFFFAPDQIKKRTADWGPGGLQQRLGGAWKAFLGQLGGWMKVTRGNGPQAVERVYLEMLEGRARPDAGHVLSLRE